MEIQSNEPYDELMENTITIGKVQRDKKEIKKKLIDVYLYCGLIPFKSLGLLNPNLESIQHQVNSYIKNGEFEKYHEKDVTALSLTSQARTELKEVMNTNRIYKEIEIDKALYELFVNYSYKDFAQLKTKSKKTDELKGNYSEDAKAERKKIKEASKINTTRKQRILRNCESFVFFYGSGIPALPSDKPELSNIATKEKNKTAYYSLREAITIDNRITHSPLIEYQKSSEFNLGIKNNAITNTKINGILKTKDINYSVIVTNKDIYHFSRNSERNAKQYISKILEKELGGCILLYPKQEIIEKMILKETPKQRLYTDNLYDTYYEKNILAVPLSPLGQLLINLLLQKDLEDFIFNTYFDSNYKKPTSKDETRYSRVKEEDKNITYLFDFTKPDIAKLEKFILFSDNFFPGENTVNFEIACFDIHQPLLQKTVPGKIKIKPVSIIYTSMMMPNNINNATLIKDTSSQMDKMLSLYLNAEEEK